MTHRSAFAAECRSRPLPFESSLNQVQLKICLPCLRNSTGEFTGCKVPAIRGWRKCKVGGTCPLLCRIRLQFGVDAPGSFDGMVLANRLPLLCPQGGERERFVGGALL